MVQDCREGDWKEIGTDDCIVGLRNGLVGVALDKETARRGCRSERRRTAKCRRVETPEIEPDALLNDR